MLCLHSAKSLFGQVLLEEPFHQFVAQNDFFHLSTPNKLRGLTYQHDEKQILEGRKWVLKGQLRFHLQAMFFFLICLVCKFNLDVGCFGGNFSFVSPRKNFI